MKICLVLLALLAVSCARPLHVASVPPPPLNKAAALAEPGHANPIDDFDDARKFFLMQRLPKGMAELPIDRYASAREHIAAMPDTPGGNPRSGLQPHLAGTSTGWTSVGPGNVGGRVRSFLINPQNPNNMYAGAVTGGVWRTNDGGQSWSPLFDSQALLNIGALAMDPKDPSVIYAGTGEWYTGFQGDGIYKTTDGGDTWTPIPSTTNSSFYYVNKIVVSPNNSQRVYAATWNGVWGSTNGGAAWTQLLTTKTAYAGCQDLAIRPDMSTDTIFASCTGATALADYQILLNSTAPSTAWTQVQTQPGMGRTSLAIAPSQPATIYALATSNLTSSPYYHGLLGLYRSTTGGAPGSWTTQVSNTDSNPLATLLLNDVRDSTLAVCANNGPVAPTGGQGSYDNLLAVDPKDPNVVWAGGVDLFRSDDAGATWGVASLWQVAYGSNQFAHADRHIIAFSPSYDGAGNQTMYLGNDGGVFRTDNARAAVATGAMGGCLATFLANSAVRWTDLNNSFTATQFYHGLAYPGGQAYMGGAQDNSVSRGSDLGSVNSWTLFSTGDGTVVGIDPLDANHIVQSKQRLTLEGAIDGSTFLSKTTGITENPNNFPFVPALAVDPNDGNRMYIGGVVNLWRSIDGANTWTAAAPVEINSSVTSIAVSPSDSNTVLFGTQSGLVYNNSAALTSTNSTAWTSSKPRSGVVSGLAIDPTNPQVIYATYSTFKSINTDAHVYKSVDGGNTWTASDGTGAASLPDTPVFRLLINPYNPSTLYLGSDVGVFISTDGGVTWAHDPNQFSGVIVEDLAFDQVNNPNWLFAFTYGRGVYRTPLSGSLAPTCHYQVNPASITVDGYGSMVPISVTAPAGCSWVGLPGNLPTAFQIQSPAQGSGSGMAFINIEPNTGAARSDTLNVANTAVAVNQSAVSAISHNQGDLVTAPVTLPVPGMAQISLNGLTSTVSDPVHSCTGSADFRTSWWRVTPTANGTLQLLANGRRVDVYGNSGIVITAYPAANTASELGCATVPQDMNTPLDGAIRFNVTAGTAYLVEVGALGSAASFAGTITVVASMSSASDVTLSLAPATMGVTAGGNNVQFTSTIGGTANTAVRWSLTPPVGTISASGLYTPPVTVSAPVQVTVAATTFAVPRKQASAMINLVPSGGGGPQPVITSVTNAASGAASIAPNTWVAINGTDLAQTTRVWLGSDFIAGQMPVALDNVSVFINGHRAYVFYISPTQINALAPFDGTFGPVSVVVSTAKGASAPFTVSQAPYSPSFFLFAGKYVAATHADGSLVGATTLYPGQSTPAKRGDSIALYGNGFGDVLSGLIPGLAAQSGVLPATPVFSIGGLPVSVQYGGVISPGLYQFNVMVPASAPNGDNPLTVRYMGYTGPTGLFITVGQ